MTDGFYITYILIIKHKKKIVLKTSPYRNILIFINLKLILKIIYIYNNNE